MEKQQKQPERKNKWRHEQEGETSRQQSESWEVRDYKFRMERVSKWINDSAKFKTTE